MFSKAPLRSLSFSFGGEGEAPSGGEDYRIARFPKGRGAFREIYIPSENYKRELNLYKLVLNEIFAPYAESSLDHAFVAGRNCVTNAACHIGADKIVSVDICSFFDSINGKALDLVPDGIRDRVFIDGAPRQGLPTSPVISNIAFIGIDEELRIFFESIGCSSCSRYADDITVGVGRASVREILSGLACILGRHGFHLNNRKTVVQSRSGGNLIVTGISVSDVLVPTRETRRKLRAAKHSGSIRSFRGLREWSLCKFPKGWG